MALLSSQRVDKENLHPSLVEERSKATFDVETLTFALDGGRAITEKRRRAEQLALDDPVFLNPPFDFLPRDAQYSLALKKSLLVEQRLKEHGLENDDFSRVCFRRAAMPKEVSPTALHFVMFIPALRGQATDEQQAKWLPRALNCEILGTYAQTELGHGTYLRGIETTATYDVDTREFILDSPTVTSSKWWPGSLGKTANFAIVVAQLLTQGKKRGNHLFLVQLRDLETHRPLPGISLGDIGPKMGQNSNDNGFLRLRKVRIPREQMLMRHAHVLADGTYKSQPMSTKLTYGSMLLVRVGIVEVCARGLAEAATVAVRYGCVRRQGAPENGRESLLMDLPVHRARVLPHLAAAYAFWVTGSRLKKLHAAADLSQLGELHALCCGLKALSSSASVLGSHELLLCCGGLGYSHASGLPRIFCDLLPACIFEGENSVLLQQTARFLLKTLQDADRPGHSVAYLVLKPTNDDSLLSVLKKRSLLMLRNAAAKFQASVEEHQQSWRAAFQTTSVSLVSCARAHCMTYVAESFTEFAEKQQDDSVREVLRTLCRLFLVQEVTAHSGDFLLTGCLSPHAVTGLQEERERLLAELRPNAVPLVDAFDFPDRILNSMIGCYDGNAYERVVKWADESPLNQEEVHESFHKYTRPCSLGEPLSKL